jgi:hypothetical protein
MADLAYLALTASFFAAMFGYVRACEVLGRWETVSAPPPPADADQKAAR